MANTQEWSRQHWSANIYIYIYMKHMNAYAIILSYRYIEVKQYLPCEQNYHLNLSFCDLWKSQNLNVLISLKKKKKKKKKSTHQDCHFPLDISELLPYPKS